jgi:uncharacterized protein YdaU (DUF1376 family)
MKIVNYFPHDFNARNDKKLVELLMNYGLEGIGVYWCLIELLYESEGKIHENECERIAFELRTQCSIILNVLQSNLFVKIEDYFISDSQQKRAEKIKSKSKANAAAAAVRWGKNANAMQTQCKRNAKKPIKENKILNNKEIIL